MTGLPSKRHNREFGRMFDPINDFFSDDFFAPLRNDIHSFRTDIKDTGKEYVVEAEMPGFDKNDIRIDYDRGYLTISAHREEINKEEREHYIRQERHSGQFVRRFHVEDIEEGMIEATFTNGVLTITCPKKMISGNEPKRIEIH